MYGYFNACASAQTMVASGYKSPIYLMNFNFGHDRTTWPEMVYGSYHGVVLSFLDTNTVFRSAYFPTAFATDGANQLGVMTNAYIKNVLWSSNGNPNGTGNSKWTKYASTSSKWLVLDATRDTASSAMENIDITSYSQVFVAIDSDTTISSSAKEAVIKTILNGRWFSSALDTKYGNESLWK